MDILKGFYVEEPELFIPWELSREETKNLLRPFQPKIKTDFNPLERRCFSVLDEYDYGSSLYCIALQGLYIRLECNYLIGADQDYLTHFTFYLQEHNGVEGKKLDRLTWYRLFEDKMQSVFGPPEEGKKAGDHAERVEYDNVWLYSRCWHHKRENGDQILIDYGFCHDYGDYYSNVAGVFRCPPEG